MLKSEANNSAQLLTKREIADYLKLSTRSVELWMKRGLPHMKLGPRRTRYRIADVDAYLNKNCRGS